MYNAGENRETIDNSRPRTREVRARVHEVNFTSARSEKRIEFRKTPKQFIVAPRPIDVLSTESEHDDLGTRIEIQNTALLRRYLLQPC